MLASPSAVKSSRTRINASRRRSNESRPSTRLPCLLLRSHLGTSRACTACCRQTSCITQSCLPTALMLALMFSVSSTAATLTSHPRPRSTQTMQATSFSSKSATKLRQATKADVKPWAPMSSPLHLTSTATHRATGRLRPLSNSSMPGSSRTTSSELVPHITETSLSLSTLPRTLTCARAAISEPCHLTPPEHALTRPAHPT